MMRILSLGPREMAQWVRRLAWHSDKGWACVHVSLTPGLWTRMAGGSLEWAPTLLRIHQENLFIPSRKYGTERWNWVPGALFWLPGASVCAHARAYARVPTHTKHIPSLGSSSGKALLTLYIVGSLTVPQNLLCPSFSENQPGEMSLQGPFIPRSHKLIEGATAKDCV